MHTMPSLLPRELILLVTSGDRRYGSMLHNLRIFGLIFATYPRISPGY